MYWGNIWATLHRYFYPWARAVKECCCLKHGRRHAHTTLHSSVNSLDLFLRTCFLPLQYNSTVEKWAINGLLVCAHQCLSTLKTSWLCPPCVTAKIWTTEHFLQDHDFRAGNRKLRDSPWNSWAGRTDFQSSWTIKSSSVRRGFCVGRVGGGITGKNSILVLWQILVLHPSLPRRRVRMCKPCQSAPILLLLYFCLPPSSM